MNEKIRKQLLKIRATGEINLFDSYGVQRIANREHYYELVIFIEDHRKAYGHFIMTGKYEEE